MKYLYAIIVILLLPYTTGFSPQEIETNSETIEITPLLENCNSTTKVFRIERLNYTSESEELMLNYVFWQDENKTNINKTINKYTTSNTGVFVGKNSSKEIRFVHGNETLSWDVQTICAKNTAATNETNITTEIKQEQENQEEVEEKNICPKELIVKTNKNILSAGEKLEFTFSFDKKPETYEITYWIEDNDEKQIKKEYTTTNLATKSYTLSSTLQHGTYLVLRGVAKTPCQTIRTEKIIGIEKNNRKEIIDLAVEDGKNGATVKFIVKDSQGGIYNLFIETFEGEKIGTTHQIELSEGSYLETTIKEQLQTEEEYLLAVVEIGTERHETYFKKELQEKKKTQIQELKLHNTYTRQTKLDEELNWYVRSEGTPPYEVEVVLGTESYIEIIELQNPVTTHFVFYEHNTNNNITTILRQGNKSVLEEKTISLEKKENFQTRIDDAKAEKTEPVITTEITANTIKTISPPLQPKTIVISVLVAILLILGVLEIKKKILIKEGSFIKR